MRRLLNPNDWIGRRQGLCVALLMLIILLSGCSRPRAPVADAKPIEDVVTPDWGRIQSYDMKDGIRCYLYVNAISCLRVTP